MTSYRRKPVEVDAWQVPHRIASKTYVPVWVADRFECDQATHGVTLRRNCGWHDSAHTGDYLVRFSDGGIFIVKPEDFDREYERVEG